MIFSPDDFDTSGLELVPKEGEEPSNPLDGYSAEQRVADAELYSVVEKPAAEVVASLGTAETVQNSIDKAISNPYNLATESVHVDEDGLENHIDSFSSDQRDALASVMPEFATDLNRMGGTLNYEDRISDYEVMELGVKTLTEKMKDFAGEQEDFMKLKQSYLAMRKAFPGFSLGEPVTVTYDRGSGQMASTTFK